MNVTKGHFDKTVDEEQTHDNVPDGYSGTIYTCSMHPEVRSTEEGSCPKCGMFLVPEGEEAEHGQHGHTSAHDAASVDVMKGGEYDARRLHRHGLYLPDACAGASSRARLVSDLRHGPGARNRQPGG